MFISSSPELQPAAKTTWWADGRSTQKRYTTAAWLAAAIRPGSQIKEGIPRLLRVGGLLGKKRMAPTSSMEATATGGRGSARKR